MIKVINTFQSAGLVHKLVLRKYTLYNSLGGSKIRQKYVHQKDGRKSYINWLMVIILYLKRNCFFGT